ncbi:MAG: helix-turn-helix transcriptional regulator [Pseudomonadota bacterium]|jgi:transcriptional regulator with XRE-family HTH domain
MNNNKQFGERLRIARLRKNMTQVEVAVALEEFDISLSQTAVGKIERGERNLYVHQLIALANILDVSTQWILEGGDLSIS